MVAWGLWGLGALAWLAVAQEKNFQGDPSWRQGKPAASGELQVTCSTASVQAGELVSLEVSAREVAVFRAEVFRLGVYGGSGAAKVWSSSPFTVSTVAQCQSAPCPPRHSFSFEVARHWAPGLYLVKVTRADGLRSFTSLVVKEVPADAPRS